MAGNMTLAGNSEFKSWVSQLKKDIRHAQVKAAIKVNTELLRLYWRITLLSSNKSEFERRKLMYPLISVFIIVVGALLLVFANKIIKNNKVNRIGIKVVGGILIIVGLLLLYFLLSGKLTVPLSK